MNKTLKTLTGTGGETPAKDGGMRATIGGFIMACVLFASTLTEISAEQMAALGTIVTSGLFIAFGLFDHSQKQPDVPEGE